MSDIMCGFYCIDLTLVRHNIRYGLSNYNPVLILYKASIDIVCPRQYSLIDCNSIVGIVLLFSIELAK